MIKYEINSKLNRATGRTSESGKICLKILWSKAVQNNND